MRLRGPAGAILITDRFGRCQANDSVVCGMPVVNTHLMVLVSEVQDHAVPLARHDAQTTPQHLRATRNNNMQ
jgi:hypothetical protein